MICDDLRFMIFMAKTNDVLSRRHLLRYSVTPDQKGDLEGSGKDLFNFDVISVLTNSKSILIL